MPPRVYCAYGGTRLRRRAGSEQVCSRWSQQGDSSGAIIKPREWSPESAQGQSMCGGRVHIFSWRSKISLGRGLHLTP